MSTTSLTGIGMSANSIVSQSTVGLAPSQNDELVHYDGRIWTWLHPVLSIIVELFIEAMQALFSSFQLVLIPRPFILHDPTLLNKYGWGCVNFDWASCYLIATLQMVRQTQLLQAYPEAAVSNPDASEMRKNLTDFFASISKETGGAEQIQTIKKLCFDSGFSSAFVQGNRTLADPVTRRKQHDATEFLEFLLDKLNIPPIGMSVKTNHGLGIKIAKFAPLEELAPSGLQECYKSTVSLPVSVGRKDTELATLLTADPIEKTLAEQDVAQADRNRLPAEIQTAFAQKKEVSLLTTQTHEFFSLAASPAILPITLNRVEYDRARQMPLKSTCRILPSDVIDIPIKNNPTQKARYVWVGAVVHVGEPTAGHYYTYFKSGEQNGSTAYVRHDDSHVSFIAKPHDEYVDYNTTAYDDICSNASIHFYKKVETPAAPV